MANKQSFYRNWHLPATWYRTKKMELCNTWWAKAQKSKFGGIEITLTDGDSSKQISFILSEEHGQHLYKQLTELITTKQ